MITLDNVLLVTIFVLGFVAPAMVVLRRRVARQAKDHATLQENRLDNNVPVRSIHPIIDPEICIGSLSCVQACPVGDILGLVADKAQLMEPSKCIGHGRCAVDCPVDAIKLVYGTLERGIDLPNTDESFESARRGVYLIGEIVGMGLIRNCFVQGLELADNLAEHTYTHDENKTDVLIVGSGPAGLACAIGASNLGLNYRLIEQGTLGGTVAHFPRNKIVMVDDFKIPGHGKIRRGSLSKEDLLKIFKSLTNEFQIPIEEHTRVTGINGHDGKFEVITTRGTFLASKVVLAIGRRGNPRKLDVDGEELEKVMYGLRESEPYNDRSVLIVGGGDSAIEAACQLADESSAQISISYRKSRFQTCRPENRNKIESHITTGRIQALMDTSVAQISADSVTIACNDTGDKEEVQNDYLFVCIGGELPTKFLNDAQISVESFHSEQKQGGSSTHTSKPKPSKLEIQKRKNKWLSYFLISFGLLIIGSLVWIGQEYYWIDESFRTSHPLHQFLKPSGIWGHSVGIGATFFMMLNFLYPLRKRWKRMKGTAPIQTWLILHIFVGLMSPVVIGFHAAFLHNNRLATATWLALGIVVLTGLFGRYLYSFVPVAEGEVLSVEQVESMLRRYENRALRHMKNTSSKDQVVALIHKAAHYRPGTNLFLTIVGFPFSVLGREVKIRQARRLFQNPIQFSDFRRSLSELRRVKTQLSVYDNLKKFFGMWRIFHSSLAVFLVLLITLHTGIMLFLGYGLGFD